MRLTDDERLCIAKLQELAPSPCALDFVVEGAVAGVAQYGHLNLASERRDMALEIAQEARDMAFYASVGMALAEDDTEFRELAKLALEATRRALALVRR